MTEKNDFNKEKMETIDIEKKKGLLEELNVPPQAIKFIKDNAKNLQIGAVCLLLVILSWTGYDYYTETQRETSTALLHEALQEKDVAKKSELLQGVIDEYPRTDAAVWSRLELAHTAYDEGKMEVAAEKYGKVLDSLSSANPLVPLVVYSLAQAYEAGNKMEDALAAYTRLAKYAGFEAEGLLGEGRMYEMQGELQKSRAAYVKINSMDDVEAPIKEWVSNKLLKLPADEAAAAE